MKTNKRIALLAVTLTLSTSAQANFLKDLLDKFQSVNKESKSECASMSNDEVANLCVQEVCGDPAKNQIIFNAEQAQQKFHTPEIQAKMDDQEKKIRHYEQYLKDEISKLNEARKDLDNLTADQISDEEAEEIIREVFNQMRDEHKILKNFSKDVSKNDTVKMVIPPTSRFAGIYKEVISKINVYDHLDASRKLNLLSVDPEKAFKTYQNKAKELQAELNKTGKTIEFNFQEQEEELLKAGKSYSPEFYIRLVNAAKTAGIEIQKTYCDLACKNSLVTFIKKKSRKVNLEQMTAKALEKLDFDDSIAECKATMMLTNIKAKDSTEMEKEFPKLIEKFKNNTSLKFSAHSKGLLLDKIDKDLKLQFNFNLYADDKSFAVDEQIIHLKSQPVTSLPDKYIVATTQSHADVLIKNIPRCKKLEKVATVTDMAAYDLKKNQGTLYVSPFSCEHTHLGKEIMAHELGHVVSYMIAATPGMSSETKVHFGELRECSRKEKKSTKFPGLLSPHEGDKWTTEEDTADLFGFALSENKEDFTGCVLVAPAGDKYQRLGMKKSFIDTHSAGTQRLMLELQYKNPDKITEACAEVIKRSKAKITNKCF